MTGQKIGPVRQASFYLTRRCNLECRYCRAAKIEKEELTVRRACKALEVVARKVRPEFLVFRGGEPFVRNDLGAIVDCANDQGLDYTVLTNGTPDRITSVAPRLKSLTFSLDRPIEDGAAWDERAKSAWSKLRRLMGRVPDLAVYVTVSRDNIQVLDAIVERVNALDGVRAMFGVVQTMRDRPRISDDGLRLTPRDAEAFGLLKGRIRNQQNVSQYFDLAPRHASRLDWRCDGGHGHLTIDCDGALLACGDWVGREVPAMSVFDYDPDRWAAACVSDRQACAHGCFASEEIQLAFGGSMRPGAVQSVDTAAAVQKDGPPAPGPPPPHSPAAWAAGGPGGFVRGPRPPT